MRIEYPDPESLAESVRSVVEERPSNVARMLALASPGVFHSTLDLIISFVNKSSLDPVSREIAILRVGYLSDAKYELFQHESLARHVGLTDAQIAAVKLGGDVGDILGEKGAAIIAFVDDLVSNVRAGDETLAAVRRFFGDVEVADLILLTGAYMMICRFLETTGIEPDERPMDWDNIPVLARD
jgi:4-carboxymuconolactone decarboxylase